MKICTGCGEEKSFDAFRKLSRSPDGRAYRCRTCATAYDSTVTRSPVMYNADRNRNNKLKSKYGITAEQYDAMLSEQGGVCAICRRGPEYSKHGRLAVDHDHESGAVRSLLCSSCNVALGLLQDDPDMLMDAATYLLRHRAFQKEAAQ